MDVQPEDYAYEKSKVKFEDLDIIYYTEPFNESSDQHFTGSIKIEFVKFLPNDTLLIELPNV